MSNTKPDSATFSTPKVSPPVVASPSRHGHQSRAKDTTTRNPPSQKHTRQSNRGKQNSNQRSAATSADESATDSQATLATPTKKPAKGARKQAKQPLKVSLLTRAAPEGEQQELLARFASPSQTPALPQAPASGRSSGKRNRRPQDSPPRTTDDSVVRTPTRRPNKQQFQPSPQQPQTRTAAGVSGPATIYSPTPRVGHAMTTPHSVVPGRGGSPSGGNRSNHYAGASFNNSPAPGTLPLPPSFLISPSSAASPPPSFQVPTLASSPSSNRNSAVYMRDDDVFAMAASAPVSADRILRQQHSLSPVNAVLSERSRQLEHMLAIGGARPNNFSATLDLAQPATDMASMFQKLRLIKEMSQNRPATVEPVAHQLTPV
ncbi:hypothetical protein H4R27_002197 [Coemansia aciculifera]|nr:hypothetical protein H4R27_002197 [Coemansia aciculifera]